MGASAYACSRCGKTTRLEQAPVSAAPSTQGRWTFGDYLAAFTVVGTVGCMVVFLVLSPSLNEAQVIKILGQGGAVVLFTIVARLRLRSRQKK